MNVRPVIVPSVLAAFATLAVAPRTLAADALRAGSLSWARQPGDAPAAEAAQAAAPIASASSDPGFTVRIEPMIWFATPSGDLRLPAATTTGGMSGGGEGGLPPPASPASASLDSLDIDRARLRPAGTVRIASGNWQFAFSGTQYEITRDALSAGSAFQVGTLALDAGDTFNINFEFGLYELGAGYRIWDKDFQADSANPADAVPLKMNLLLIGGARFYDITIGVDRIGGSGGSASAGYDDLFIEPFLGARLETAFTEQFGVEVQSSVGFLPGDDTSTFSVDIAAGFYWRPTPNFGVMIGYRQLAFDLEDGQDAEKFEYDGRLAGLLAGVEIRF